MYEADVVKVGSTFNDRDSFDELLHDDVVMPS